ncbi:unnamed protein product [Ectocarpus sp. CCAP 1310/34]|nr:unnamed protein product [Ectocarpus sp. CCAP 1310/34]
MACRVSYIKRDPGVPYIKRDPRVSYIKRDPWDKTAAAFCGKRSPHSPPG